MANSDFCCEKQRGYSREPKSELPSTFPPRSILLKKSALEGKETGTWDTRAKRIVVRKRLSGSAGGNRGLQAHQEKGGRKKRFYARGGKKGTSRGAVHSRVSPREIAVPRGRKAEGREPCLEGEGRRNETSVRCRLYLEPGESLFKLSHAVDGRYTPEEEDSCQETLRPTRIGWSKKGEGEGAEALLNERRGKIQGKSTRVHLSVGRRNIPLCELGRGGIGVYQGSSSIKERENAKKEKPSLIRAGNRSAGE